MDWQGCVIVPLHAKQHGVPRKSDPALVGVTDRFLNHSGEQIGLGRQTTFGPGSYCDKEGLILPEIDRTMVGFILDLHGLPNFVYKSGDSFAKKTWCSVVKRVEFRCFSRLVDIKHLPFPSNSDTKSLHPGNAFRDRELNMECKRLLAVKFLVVDGLSSTAAQFAAGVSREFRQIPERYLKDCGYHTTDKGSLSFSMFIRMLNVRRIEIDSPASFSDLDIEPVHHYIRNRRFGYPVGSRDIAMAYCYMVHGMSFRRIEEKFGCPSHRNMAKTSVYKLGGFRGIRECAAMTKAEFNQRLIDLGLEWDWL